MRRLSQVLATAVFSLAMLFGTMSALAQQQPEQPPAGEEVVLVCTPIACCTIRTSDGSIIDCRRLTPQPQ